MISLKPYLARAIYDWIVDNNFTPYLMVNADHEGVIVPRQYVQDGRIILNLRPQAVHGLAIGNHNIVFNARFGGRPMLVDIPMHAVLAIYALENGKGMVFDDQEEDDDSPPPNKSAPKVPENPPARKKPILKLVK